MANVYTAKVVQLYPDDAGINVKLEGMPYVVLKTEHPSYASIFSLLMASGANKVPQTEWQT